jgi:hypothetical protein
MTPAQFVVALSILLGAGLSDLIGQSVVLFLNRVPPRRFLLCLASGSLLFGCSALGWTTSLWILGMLLGLELPLAQCLWLVALAHVPMLLGWTVLLPHFGRFLFHALRAWVFLDLVVAVGVATGAPLDKVVWACLPGWLAHFSLTHLELLRLERFQAWLWRTVTGSELSR